MSKLRRAIELEGIDKILEITKMTKINNPNFKSIHIDELNDGSFRIIYGAGIIEDFSEIKNFKIIRKN